MRHQQHCDALQAEIAGFAAILDDTDVDTDVPTCPGWSVEDLARHLGRVHRWATQLVSELTPVRIGPTRSTDGAADSRWILDGGSILLETLRRTDPDLPMWAWGRDQHVRFWSRRQLHETLVHRIDLEMALGLEPTALPTVVSDAIDEHLDNLAPAASFSPPIAELRGSAGRIALRDTTTARRWTITVDPFAEDLGDDDRPVDAELGSDGLGLLEVLYRRRSIDDIDGALQGDGALLRFWLDHLVLA